MATIRVPTFRRSEQSSNQAAVAEPRADADATDKPLGLEPASLSYVWLCILIGAAASVGIAVGFGLERAGITEGAASCFGGAIAFAVSLVPLMYVYGVVRGGSR